MQKDLKKTWKLTLCNGLLIHLIGCSQVKNQYNGSTATSSNNTSPSHTGPKDPTNGKDIGYKLNYINHMINQKKEYVCYRIRCIWMTLNQKIGRTYTIDPKEGPEFLALVQDLEKLLNNLLDPKEINKEEINKELINKELINKELINKIKDFTNKSHSILNTSINITNRGEDWYKDYEYWYNNYQVWNKHYEDSHNAYNNVMKELNNSKQPKYSNNAIADTKQTFMENMQAITAGMQDIKDRILKHFKVQDNSDNKNGLNFLKSFVKLTSIDPNIRKAVNDFIDATDEVLSTKSDTPDIFNPIDEYSDKGLLSWNDIYKHTKDSFDNLNKSPESSMEPTKKRKLTS